VQQNISPYFSLFDNLFAMVCLNFLFYKAHMVFVKNTFLLTILQASENQRPCLSCVAFHPALLQWRAIFTDQINYCHTQIKLLTSMRTGPEAQREI